MKIESKHVAIRDYRPGHASDCKICGQKVYNANFHRLNWRIEEDEEYLFQSTPSY
jgi:hypothetical protein